MGANAGLPFRLDARTLAAGDAFTFTTDIGWIDILGTPAGTAGYDDLAKTAERITLSATASSSLISTTSCG